MKYAAYFVFTLTLSLSGFASESPHLGVNMDGRPIVAEAGQPIVSYADVLDQATPSVVAVYTAQIFNVPDRYQRYPFLFPNGQYSQPGTRERKEQLGVGSGVILSEDGYIVTNHHVVQGIRGRAADEIKVRLNDGSEYEATLVGSDSKTDVAVLKIEATEALPAVTLANSDLLRVGDVVFAIGNPLDVGLTATQGIVSATERNRKGEILGPGSYENFIQTDAAINLGNSGGALVDAWGRLIGINTAIVSGSGGSIGLGFAIPVNMVLNVASNLIERGEVPRGMLGLFPSDLTREIADAFGLESTHGALVNQVQQNSPASRAGIMHGDVILQIDDVVIDSAAKLRLVVSQIMPGTEVAVRLIRRGEDLELPVRLGSLNGKFYSPNVAPSPLKGVALRVLDDEARAGYSIPAEISGVLVMGLEDDSPFVDKLAKLMVILEVNGHSVSSVEAIQEHIVEGPNRFYVWAGDAKRFVVMKL